MWTDSRAAREALHALAGLLIAVLPVTPLLAADNIRAASSRFEVSVIYDPADTVDRPFPGDDSAFCIRRNTGNNFTGDNFGARVIIACSTGAVVDLEGMGNARPWSPTHGGAHRYLVPVLPGLTGPRGSVDVVPGLGSAVSWRQVSLIDRDYYEVMMAW